VRKVALGLVAVALAACAASAQTLCSYPSRETDIRDARMTFAYRYYDDPTTPTIDVNSGRLSANYNELDDSPNSGFALAASTELALSGFVPTSWLGQGTCSYRIYPWSKGSLFLFGGLEALASTGLPQPGLDARVGLGFGRFKDVTPLAKAIEISERLLSMGAIPESLSEDTVLALAHMIERAGEYPTPGALLADMEAIVEFDAGTQLDVWTLRAVEDLALRQGKERCCGWSLQAGIGYELLDPYGGGQSVIYAGSGDAAFASSPRDQFLLHVSFSGPLALPDENSLVGSASCVVDIGTGQAMTAEYALSRIKPSGEAATTTHLACLGLTFSLSRGSLGLQVSVSHKTGVPGWAIDVSMSAALELL
jgi:hypothetical protein